MMSAMAEIRAVMTDNIFAGVRNGYFVVGNNGIKTGNNRFVVCNYIVDSIGRDEARQQTKKAMGLI